MPNASILVVNYNGKELITDFLKAIERQHFKNFEVIVVDNGSSDDSIMRIQEFARRSPIGHVIKVIPLHRNLGFAGGNMEGLKHTNSEYVALLNNDTEPNEWWLGELLRAMDYDPNIGICASKMISHETDLIDSAGDGFSTALRGFKRGEGRETFLYNKREYIWGACAGAALYRKKMIEEIGFFDEDFFLIHEDTDLNFRAQLHGWKVLYVPTAVVHHKVRSTIGSMSDEAIYYTLRNTEFVRVKDIPLEVLMRCFFELLIGALIEFVFFAIKHRCLRLYFRAKLDALRMLPKMLKKREAILRNRKVTNRYLLNRMTPVWQGDFLRTKIKKLLYA